MTEAPLWSPSPARIAGSHITAFTKLVNERHGTRLDGYDALYAWSVAHLEDFWETWSFLSGRIDELREGGR